MASVEEICDEIALINRSRVVLNGNVNEVRNRFKENTFRIRVSGNNIHISPGFSLLSKKKEFDTTEARIKKDPGISNSVLLQSLLTNNEIISFEEELPSMNDIFIQTVSSQTNNA